MKDNSDIKSISEVYKAMLNERIGPFGDGEQDMQGSGSTSSRAGRVNRGGQHKDVRVGSVVKLKRNNNLGTEAQRDLRGKLTVNMVMAKSSNDKNAEVKVKESPVRVIPLDQLDVIKY